MWCRMASCAAVADRRSLLRQYRPIANRPQAASLHHNRVSRLGGQSWLQPRLASNSRPVGGYI